MVSVETEKYEELKLVMIQVQQTGMAVLQPVRLNQDGTARVNHQLVPQFVVMES